MQKSYEFYISGREVHHSFLKFLAIAIIFFFFIVFFPVITLLHFILRLTGRNGIFYDKGVYIKKESFKRR